MSLIEFQDEALEKFTKNITDVFFCFIENDPALLAQYRAVVAGRRTDASNKALGMAIKEWFRLGNSGACRTPKSKLISAYTKHTRQV